MPNIVTSADIKAFMQAANDAAARTELGATTVGANLFTLTNPGAVTFIRMNADNTVTARSAANFRTDLGVGTGDSPSFTAVTLTGATSLLLGTAGSAVGSAGFRNATSGTITVAPPTGALGTVTNTLQAAADTFVYRATTDTLTNKRITLRTEALTINTTPTPDEVTPASDSADRGVLTAVAAALKIMNPTGTPTDGQVYELRLESASSQALTYDTAFRFSDDLPAPAATTGSGKVDRLLFKYDSTDSKWDLAGKNFGFA